MKDASIDSAAEVGRRARPPVNAVTMRAYVSKGANARNPPLDVCNAIGKVLGVMGQWLFDGKGPRRPPPPAPPRDTTITHVPLLDSVTAGRLAQPASQIPVEDVPLLAFADLGAGDWFALKVEGDSMNKVSPDGSIIVVNRADTQLISGRCYVFSIKGETTYKRWQNGDTPYLESYSTETFAPIFPKSKKPLTVVGRVKRTVLDL